MQTNLVLVRSLALILARAAGRTVEAQVQIEPPRRLAIDQPLRTRRQARGLHLEDRDAVDTVKRRGDVELNRLLADRDAPMEDDLPAARSDHLQEPIGAAIIERQLDRTAPRLHAVAA